MSDSRSFQKENKSVDFKFKYYIKFLKKNNKTKHFVEEDLHIY